MNLPPAFELGAVLSEAGALTLVRAKDATGAPALLQMPSAQASGDVSSFAAVFTRELNLRAKLDPSWALMPGEIVSVEVGAGRAGPALVLADPGGAPLAALPGGLSPGLPLGTLLEQARAAAHTVAGAHGAGL
ncbi:MAG TPA: hypothetical protein VGF45_18005, partial [Polyangia bacterium]